MKLSNLTSIVFMNACAAKRSCTNTRRNNCLIDISEHRCIIQILLEPVYTLRISSCRYNIYAISEQAANVGRNSFAASSVCTRPTCKGVERAIKFSRERLLGTCLRGSQP